MFAYFRDSFITKQDVYRWAEPTDEYNKDGNGRARVGAGGRNGPNRRAVRRRGGVDLLVERQLQHRGDGAGLLQRHSVAEKVRGEARDERQPVETARGR